MLARAADVIESATYIGWGKCVRPDLKAQGLSVRQADERSWLVN
jgi:hypothetical protein